MEWVRGTTEACTPQVMASRLAVVICGVRPIIGAAGRSRATCRAELAEFVSAAIAAASMVRETAAAAAAMALEVFFSVSGRRRSV